MAILKVEDLNVYYGNIHALKGITLYVNKGEVVSLIGANGAGKTTTLQAISGLLAKAYGKVYLKDKDVSKEKAFKITKMGMAQVPEGRRVFSNLSVEDNLSLGAIAVKEKDFEKKERIERIYELFPVLKERRKQKAGTLSGGEQQMLAMGRAIMTKPDVLLLDEPSMGLSPLYVQKIFDTVKLLKKQGSTILIVEQNANLALEVSDRGYVLETGKIVKSASAQALKNDSSVREAYLGV